VNQDAGANERRTRSELRGRKTSLLSRWQKAREKTRLDAEANLEAKEKSEEGKGKGQARKRVGAIEKSSTSF
jgi:hypothetical protein